MRYIKAKADHFLRIVRVASLGDQGYESHEVILSTSNYSSSIGSSRGLGFADSMEVHHFTHCSWKTNNLGIIFSLTNWKDLPIVQKLTKIETDFSESSLTVFPQALGFKHWNFDHDRSSTSVNKSCVGCAVCELFCYIRCYGKHVP